jgi:hypothetical protein
MVPARRADEPEGYCPKTARFWVSVSHEEVKAGLAEAATADCPFPGDRFTVRGIVICAGGARLFTCAWVAIALLRRHLACTLPIEVWHLGPEEMGPPMRALLEELGAQPVDAFEVAKRHRVERLGGWELKPYAVMHSRFREVLLLDADNVPVRDPEFLFDRPEFRDTGALFWPDIVRLSQDNEIWAISGLNYRDTPSVESGEWSSTSPGAGVRCPCRIGSISIPMFSTSFFTAIRTHT